MIIQKYEIHYILDTQPDGLHETRTKFSGKSGYSVQNVLCSHVCMKTVHDIHYIQNVMKYTTRVQVQRCILRSRSGCDVLSDMHFEYDMHYIHNVMTDTTHLQYFMANLAIKGQNALCTPM